MKLLICRYIFAKTHTHSLQHEQKGGREDYRGEKNVEEFVYNGSKYPEGTAERYFGEGSVGG